MKDRKFQAGPRPKTNATEIILAESEKVSSTGGGATNWDEFDLGPILELSPHLESIMIHLLQEHRSSANLKHRVRLYRSFDGVTWVPTLSADLIASQNTQGDTISAEYSTRTSFGRYMKITLGLEDDGTAYNAEFSITAHLKFWN